MSCDTHMSVRHIVAVILLFAGMGCIPASVQSQESLNPNFDISGVREFWKIVDILQTDTNPSPAQWKALFDTPGHNALRREFRDAFFIRYFQAAYMPSRYHVRDEILKEAEQARNRFRRAFPKSELEALDWTLKNRDRILAKMQSFEDFPYTIKATEEAMKFLPDKEPGDHPKVAFVIFNDSRGYDPVVMSLNKLAQEEKVITDDIMKKLERQGHSRHWPHVLYFAHEFFHAFRDKKRAFQYPPTNHGDYTLIWLLDQIENEGIADQINVKQLYYNDGCFTGTDLAQKEISERVGAADEIRQFNEILTGMYDHPDWIYGLSMQARRIISRSGHVAGFFMTNVILKHYTREDLVRVVRNPFKFFVLYNKAALKDGAVPVFSDKAIAVIQELEKKYSL